MTLPSGMEWFTASLAVPDGAAGLGVTSEADSTANVTIVDDDKVTVYFDSSVYATTEEEGAVTMTVVVDGNFSVPFTVTVATEADSAEGKQTMIMFFVVYCKCTLFTNKLVDNRMCLFPSVYVNKHTQDANTIGVSKV